MRIDVSLLHVVTQRHPIRHLRSLVAVGLLASASIAGAQGQPAANKDELPATFRPPRAVADVINAEDELTTEEAYAQWKKKELPNFAMAIQQAKPTPAQVKLIEEGCKIRVQRLSLKQHRANLKPVRVDIYRDLHLQGTPAVREVALKTIAAEADRLLAGNLTVRLQALILLSELESAPANLPKKLPPVLYGDALTIYFKVLNDKNQPEAVRLLAATLTEKVVRDAGLTTNPPHKLRVEAGKVLVALALKNGESDWYQKAVVGALQAVNLPTLPDAANTQQPLIATTLQKIVADGNRSLPVRVRAANALGKVTLPQSGIDIGAMTKDCLKLSRTIVQDYNSNAGNRTRDAFLLQEVYLGLKAWRDASPNDKNVTNAYSAITKPTGVALNSLNNAQPGQLPASVLDDINGIVGAEKPTSAEKQGVVAKPAGK